MKEKRKFLKKTDVLIAAAALAVGAVIWLAYCGVFSDRPAKAEIYLNSKLVKTVYLVKGAEKSFTVPGREHVVFHIDREGNICFESSDCPDKICVRTGKLHIVGQSAACLPNGLVLKIVPADRRGGDELDAVG